jgi:MFS family permease
VTASSPFLALQHRNFRLLWLGQIVSVSGSMMQMAGVLWHVSLLVEPSHRGMALGFVGLVRVVPIVLFSLVAGMAADVYDRRRIMIVTQSAMAVLAGVLAVLTMGGLRSAWPIYVLSALSSAAGAFDGPARQALVPNLVPRAHLPNAIGLNTIMFQVAAVLGPSSAGLVIAGLGVQWIYWINAASFLCVLAALLMMRDVRGKGSDTGAGPQVFTARSALDGLRFVFAQPLIRSSMLLDFFATFFSSATALLPIFAQDILAVGASGYGWLYAAPSVGALLASAAMVRIVDRITRRGWVLIWSVVAYGIATVAFGLSHAFWMMFGCLALTGAADTVSMVLRNILRQMETPDHLRGRMVGVNMVFFMGGPQLGELEAGMVAQWFGAPFSVVSGGLGCLAATGWIAARTKALREYRTGA